MNGLAHGRASCCTAGGSSMANHQLQQQLFLCPFPPQGGAQGSCPSCFPFSYATSSDPNLPLLHCPKASSLTHVSATLQFHEGKLQWFHTYWHQMVERIHTLKGKLHRKFAESRLI